MTNRLMETACARLCLLTPIAWDESMPPLFSRMAVRRAGDCGRRLRCLAGAVFVRAAGSADFHAASLKFSVFLC